MSISSPGESFESWKEPFKLHSISEVHQKERELRSQADGKKQQLRALVGQSYRDLLGTANTIMTMHETMLLTCRKVDKLSEKCDARDFSRRADISCRYERKKILQHHARNTTVARLEILRGVPFIVNSLCKYERDALSAAKLYMASKQLLKLTDDGSAIYMNIEQRHTMLLRRLMRYIDDILLYTSHDSNDKLSNGILAYCTVSQCSLLEGIKHVLGLWQMQLKEQEYNHPTDFSFAIELAKECLHSIQSFTKNIDIHNKSLTTRPDGGLQWLSIDTTLYEEILSSEMWQVHEHLKQNNIDQDEIEALSQTAFREYEDILEQGLLHFLSNLETLDVICSARQTILTQIYTALTVFNKYNSDISRYTRQFKIRTVELIKNHERTLCSFASKVAEIIKSQNLLLQQTDPLSLWRPDYAEIPITNGGSEFIDRMKSVCDGKAPSDEVLFKILEEWRKTFQKDFAALQNLKHQHISDHDEDDEAPDYLKLDTCVQEAEELLTYQQQCAIENANLLFQSLADVIESPGTVKDWGGCVLLLRAFHMAKSQISSLPGYDMFDCLEQRNPQIGILHLTIAELIVEGSYGLLSRIPEDSVLCDDFILDKLWSSGQPSLPTQPSSCAVEYVMRIAAKPTILESTIVEEELIETIKSTARRSVQSYLETTLPDEVQRKAHSFHHPEQKEDRFAQFSEVNEDRMEETGDSGISHVSELGPTPQTPDKMDSPPQDVKEDLDAAKNHRETPGQLKSPEMQDQESAIVSSKNEKDLETIDSFPTEKQGQGTGTMESSNQAKVIGVDMTSSSKVDVKKVQLYFDLCFLSAALRGRDENEAMYLIDLPSSVSLTQGLPDRDKSCERMQEKARDFVKQTALLTML